MSEKLDELQNQLTEAATEEREWKELLDSAAWQRYATFLTNQRNMRKEVVLMTPISAENTAFAQEFYKGEAMGLSLALSFPQTQLELAEMKRRTLTKETELEHESEAEERTDVSRVGDPEPFGE